MPDSAFVLAAGFGTRLRPLTDHRPKPLMPVLGATVLDQALGLCQRYGLGDVVVNAHHLHAQVIRHCAEALPEALRGMKLHVQVELPEILGTGGGLRMALDRLGDPFVVVNGDTLCDADLGALRRACISGVDAVMLLRADPDAARHGVVAIDERGTLVRLSSLALVAGAVPIREDTHFTGIHALSLAAVGRVPRQGAACIVRTAYRELVPEGRVRGLLHAGTWVDIGSPATYLQACVDVLHGRLSLPLDPWAGGARFLRSSGPEEGDGACRIAPDADLRPPFWIGRGAVIEAGVVLGPDVVVGPGTRVGAGSQLRRVVAWDGVAVPPGSRLEDAVVHDGGILVLGAG